MDDTIATEPQVAGSRWRWMLRRQVPYFGALMVLILLVVFVIYRLVFYTAPSCFDGVQNGTEEGVDCDGGCARVCEATITAPYVQWAETFRINDNLHHAVGYVENANIHVGTDALPYTFRFYDEDGLITERTGRTKLPPKGVYPLFEARIDVGDREPTRTELVLATTTEWYEVSTSRDQFVVEGRRLERVGDIPRVTATLFNSAYTPVRNTHVIAVLFDSMRNPLTASQTLVQYLDARSRSELVFTWPEKISGTLRSCDVPTDVALLLDRSGSMTSGGGNPPEPLESAKEAATIFLDTLREDDQATFISYATDASLDQPLTSDIPAVREVIAGLELQTDGVQYTNIYAAIKTAHDELISERHNRDARQAIILLTDGEATRPLTGAGEEDNVYAASAAQEAADAAKAEGVTIYTIGFGDVFGTSTDDGLNAVTFIRNLASSEEKSYRAPSIEDLNAVYSSITETICEDGPTIIDIIPIPEVTR